MLWAQRYDRARQIDCNHMTATAWVNFKDGLLGNPWFETLDAGQREQDGFAPGGMGDVTRLDQLIGSIYDARPASLAGGDLGNQLAGLAAVKGAIRR